ncbi:MAG TPA: rhodanese-like domain-containing protein, partial [Bacillus sp. (in: firmicutes)]|nr:rhodanese-like domain-containing protein [Bacillus sp. (in: firmicutes)]
MYENNNYSVTSDELKLKLDSKDPFMLFDIRDSKQFEQNHIPGSSYAVCNEESKKNIMPRLPKDVEIILVGENEEYPKQISQMMRQIGLNAKYLSGGISSWKWEFNRSKLFRDISPKELKTLLDSFLNDKEQQQQKLLLLDVREPNEFKQWSIDGSTNIPLSKLLRQESLSAIPKNKKIVTICPRGNRSTIAKYVLERYGYNVSSLEGGLKAWSFSFEYATTEYNNINESSKVKLVQFRRIGKGCISYLLDSDGESIVIDPVYPVNDYIQKASEIGTKISKVVDTHQHADHISAAKDLAKKTGAIYYQSSYENYVDSIKGNKQIKDEDIIDVGKIKIKALYTPGHTNGSISFLVHSIIDNNNNNKNCELLFTGDTLFITGIGRPDLRDKAKEFASMLYDTLHNKLFSLSKDVLVFPAHFDKDVQSQQIISSSLGEIEKKGIGFLKLDRQSFIDKISSIVIPTPSNFKEIIAINSGNKP